MRDAAAETAKNIRAKGPKDPKLNAGVAGTGERDAPETNKLLGINTNIADLGIQKINRDERRRVDRETNDLSKLDLENRRDQLQAQGQLAETLEARRANALQILDLEYKIKDADLRTTLNTTDKDSIEHRTAQKQLDALPGQKADDERGINRQNEGAGASYLRSLTLDKPQFIQSEEVKVLDEFNRGLDDSIAKTLHLHGIFGSIIQDLIDMAIRQALIKPLAGALFGGQSGGSGGGFLGSILGAVGLGGGSSIANPVVDLAGIGIPGLATGGTIGGFGGVDKNVLSINGAPVAKVGRGEMLTVTPNTIATNQRAHTPSIREGDRNFNISVNAENSVTPAGFAQGLAQQILAEAGRMDQQAVRAGIRVSSANAVSRQVLGTEKS